MSRNAVLAAALMLAVALPAAAQGPPERDRSQLSWSLGLGAISAPRPYVGASNQLLVIPLVGLEYKRLSVQGIRVSYHLLEENGLVLDLRARYNFDGLDPDDSPFLAGMAARNGTIEAGLGLDWSRGPWALRATAFTDILGRSDGQELGLDLSRTWVFQRGRWVLTPAVGAVWQSATLIDYYYGVPPEESLPQRPTYEGDSALNLRASLLLVHRFSTRVSAIALLQAQRLDNEIVASPIVDERGAIFGLLGLNYQIGGADFRSP